MTKKKILYLINSKSNAGRAGRIWKRIRTQHKVLPSNPIDIDQVDDLAGLISQKNPQIVAIGGGDGSVNLVTQAILKSNKNPTIAIIPLGLGNALSYCFGVETIPKALKVLEKEPGRVKIDILKTNLKQHPIGLFCISVGFDARIVFRRQEIPQFGLSGYALSAVESFLTHPEKKIVITINRQLKLRAAVASLMISNGPVIGKNLTVAEKAKLNDGQLECTIFATKYSYMQNLRLGGAPHPLYSDLAKIRFKAHHVRVQGEPFVQIDGDSATLKNDIKVEIKPQKLWFLHNELSQISQPHPPFLKKDA
jgi:diacylglycerol kinase (ATP)